MDVRPLAQDDLPHLLSLLTASDVLPERHVMAPVARTTDDLADELLQPDSAPRWSFVLVEERELRGFVGVWLHEGDAYLDGPLLAPAATEDGAAELLEAALDAARAADLPYVDAVVGAANVQVREALERAAFEAYDSACVWERDCRREVTPAAGAGAVRILRVGRRDAGAYVALLDAVAGGETARPTWSEEEVAERLEDPEVLVFAAYAVEEAASNPSSVRQGLAGALGVVELELLAEDGFAEVAFVGVRPDWRRRGVGRALVDAAARAACALDDVERIVARSPDEDVAAEALAAATGFVLQRATVAFSRELP